MHFLHEEWLWAWHWLTGENGTRATVLLVFITAWYAWLTYRMAKAMNRQTRAQIQPILEIEISVLKDDYEPKGSFTVKNIGTQPALIRRLRMTSHREGVEVFDEYMMYERHLMTPNDVLSFKFDFMKDFTEKGFTWWTTGVCSFNLWVVASDLSGDVTLTYIKNQFWSTLSVRNGMPWFVRKDLLVAFFKLRYYRVYYKLKSLKTFIGRPKRDE